MIAVRRFAIPIVASVALAACGGGSTNDTADTAAADEVASAATTAVAAATVADSEDGDAGPSPALTECPTPAAVSDVIGVDLELDPMSGVADFGLANCLYNEADAAEPVMVWVSVQDVSPVQAGPGLEQVAGVGDEALWSGVELTAWNGQHGVTVTFEGADPPGDPLELAKATAQLFFNEQ